MESVDLDSQSENLALVSSGHPLNLKTDVHWPCMCQVEIGAHIWGFEHCNNFCS